MRCDRLWRNARLATLAPAAPGLGVVERGAIAALEGRIAWVGAEAEAPEFDAAEVIDCGGRCHLLGEPPELGWQAGDLAVYRCEDCRDRWDIVVDEDDLTDPE